MELRHLRYFIAVAEEENVTRASGRLHVSQPGLSRQIRDLEEELGVPLFYHRAKALNLTAAGRIFLDEARAVLLRLEEATQTVKAFADGHRREIHVGYAPSLTTKILPCALRRFHELCPDVRVQLHDLSTEKMLAGLRDDSLQAALAVQPSGPPLAGIAFEEIIRYRPCAALAPSHPLAHAKIIRLSQLAGQNLIAYSRSEYPEHHDWLERIFKNVRPCPRVVAEYDSATSLIAAVEAGGGMAIVHNGFSSIAGKRLKIRPLSTAAHSFSLGIMWNKRKLAPETRRFIEAAKAHLL